MGADQLKWIERSPRFSERGIFSVVFVFLECSRRFDVTISRRRILMHSDHFFVDYSESVCNRRKLKYSVDAVANMFAFGTIYRCIHSENGF